MRIHGILGYVAVASASLCACGRTPPPSISLSSADGGDVAGADDASSAQDAGEGDAENLASGGSEGAAGDDGAANATSDGTHSLSCCLDGAFYECPDPVSLEKCAGFDDSSCLQGCAFADVACAQACGQKAATARHDVSACRYDPSQDDSCPSLDGGARTRGTPASGSAPSTGSSPSTSSKSAPSPGSKPDAGSPPIAGSAPPPPPPPPPPPTPKNACGGIALGTACVQGLECNGDEHCTQGRCYPNDVGNPCTFPSDCGSGNHCAAGCCASSAKGSACETGIDCTSGMCTQGVCQ